MKPFADTSTISVVLVDDETDPLEVLERLINDHIPDLQVVGKARSQEEAFAMIWEYEPELVFLDIRLKGDTAFDLLQRKFPAPFEVIFVTAFDRFALEAFRHHAISYILKPIDIIELKTAADRAVRLIRQQRNGEGSQEIREPHRILEGRISISNGSEVEYLMPEEILYAMADRSYCHIYLTDGSCRVISRNLKYLEEKLKGYAFFRPHRSYLVNSACIKKWNKSEGGSLILSDNSSIPLSKEGRIFLEKLY